VIDQRTLSLISGAIARRIGAIPLKGDSKHVHLLCKERLSEADRQTLKDFIPDCKLTFADPSEHPEMHKQIDLLIARYYPEPQEPDYHSHQNAEK
jgi:hypothetical protein